MSIFGRDVESNICTLITFADGQQPQVLASLKEADVSFGEWLHFITLACLQKMLLCQLMLCQGLPGEWD